MKIKRFNKINENNSKQYHIFSIVSDFDYDDDSQISNFLFDNENDAFNYLLNKVYREYKNFNLDFDSLNECKTLDELFEVYNIFRSENRENYNDGTFYYDVVNINQEKLKVDEWISLERTSKNYNL